MTGRLLSMMLIAASAAAAPAVAQNYKVVFSFPGGSGGQYPIPGVIRDSAGNFYGITANGGTDNVGAVFEVTPSGDETVLHSFTVGTDGEYPYSPLLEDTNGNFYGTTNSGGAYGKGVIYEITAGAESILYAFKGGTSDGCNPYQGLIMDGAGNLYGTTYGCGASNDGTVFEFAPGGNESILHSFAGGAKDGADPSYYGRLLMDASGNIYGVTQGGGSANDGVVYRLSAKGKLTALHDFAGGTSDGCYASGSVVMDGKGNLYGTTYACGTHNYGIVWKTSAKGNESILHVFAGGTADACSTVAGVVLDPKGNLYGNSSLCGASGEGTAWKLGRKGTLTLLHSFTNMPDGSVAYGELLRTARGELYGTTLEGGTAGFGTIWSYRQ